MTDMRINGDRLWAALMELAQIGATAKGGVKRLALTDLDKQGRDLVVRWGREAGMSITTARPVICLYSGARPPGAASVSTLSAIFSPVALGAIRPCRR